jgi:hypothetical protein
VKKVTMAGAAFSALLVLLALAVGRWAFERDNDPAAVTSSAIPPSATPNVATYPAAETDKGYLYGRITTLDGVTYEGRLRWGGHEEAFWGDYFNGTKSDNPWVAQVPPERLPQERRPTEVFDIHLLGGRPMAWPPG